ncbi:hypothetical protein HWV62_321 [Athelia sp. TMB]|nr:hypothetical protein HWV62_321 [Athelia sp. TMB]
MTIAHQIIDDIYTRALRVLRQDDSDPLRPHFHIDSISSDAIPVLEALERDEELHMDGMSQWLEEVAAVLGHLVVHLHRAAKEMRGRSEETAVKMPELVTLQYTGRPGRPRKIIDLDFLKEATSNHRQIKLTELADIMKVHRNTLQLYMKRHGVSRQYSELSNADLDKLVKTFKIKRPESGMRYIIGFLRHHGYRVQRRRVMWSLRRVDNLGKTLRERKVIKRRVYHVKRPDALWHVDGHHKLIRWGIVIHGMVDGFSRTVVAMRASSNNRASTVLDVFLEAAGIWGYPSRMRGDRGGENIDLATFLIMRNGPNRASFMWGSIERMWVEVGTQFARRWRAFFTRLEHLHRLNVQNPAHLWLLINLFLDALNEDCKSFQEQWNSHPMRGSTTNDKSPLDQCLLGQARLGVYKDECGGVHPDIINKYYGIHGKTIKRAPGDTGAGNAADEADDDVAEQVAADQQVHIRHAEIEVAVHGNPFSSDVIEANFWDLLAQMVEGEVLPEDVGLIEHEWHNGEYPLYEVLRVGNRGTKEIQISLEEVVWWQRAKLWGQALIALEVVLLAPTFSVRDSVILAKLSNHATDSNDSSYEISLFYNLITAI